MFMETDCACVSMKLAILPLTACTRAGWIFRVPLLRNCVRVKAFGRNGRHYGRSIRGINLKNDPLQSMISEFVATSAYRP